MVGPAAPSTLAAMYVSMHRQYCGVANVKAKVARGTGGPACRARKLAR